jgi:hypothetical protein
MEAGRGMREIERDFPLPVGALTLLEPHHANASESK